MIGFCRVMSRTRAIGVVATVWEKTPRIRMTRMLVTTNRSRWWVRNCQKAWVSSTSTIASSTGCPPIAVVAIVSSRAAASTTSSIGTEYTTQCCRTSSMTTSPSSEIRWRRTFGSKIRNRPIPAIHSLPWRAVV